MGSVSSSFPDMTTCAWCCKMCKETQKAAYRRLARREWVQHNEVERTWCCDQVNTTTPTKLMDDALMGYMLLTPNTFQAKCFSGQLSLKPTYSGQLSLRQNFSFHHKVGIVIKIVVIIILIMIIMILRVFSLFVFVLSCDCVAESARISVSSQDEICV